METLVERLKPGDIFRVDLGPYGFRDYKLIYCNVCRAHVEPLRRRKTDVLDEDEKKHGRTDISPGTVCTKISSTTKDPLDDEDEFVDSVPLPRIDPLFTKELDEDAAVWRHDPLDNEETTMIDPLDDDGPLDPLDDSPKPPRQKRTRNADGSRRKEPGIQTREIKDGTIRAKLFAAMKTTKSIEKLMAKTGMKKTLLLSHINDIWRHHSFGYVVEGDKVELIPPKKVAIKK